MNIRPHYHNIQVHRRLFQVKRKYKVIIICQTTIFFLLFFPLSSFSLNYIILFLHLFLLCIWTGEWCIDSLTQTAYRWRNPNSLKIVVKANLMNTKAVANFTEKHHEGQKLYQIKTPAQVFSDEYCRKFKNSSLWMPSGGYFRIRMRHHKIKYIGYYF